MYSYSQPKRHTDSGKLPCDSVQAHLGHKINGNKIHDDEKTTRSNVIKTDKVLEDGQRSAASLLLRAARPVPSAGRQ